jgi:lipoprotein-anchoring transpeptidase ErfK/SrfK
LPWIVRRAAFAAEARIVAWTADCGCSVSKAYSHGCIRLTNWDVEELAKLVEKGTPVEFID